MHEAALSAGKQDLLPRSLKQWLQQQAASWKPWRPELSEELLLSSWTQTAAWTPASSSASVNTMLRLSNRQTLLYLPRAGQLSTCKAAHFPVTKSNCCSDRHDRIAHHQRGFKSISVWFWAGTWKSPCLFVLTVALELPADPKWSTRKETLHSHAANTQ